MSHQTRQLNPLSVMWDVWNAGRGNAAGIAARQRQRLADMVAFARSSSQFYAVKYRGLPDSFSEISQLPHVTKQELMQRFDDWVTDPAVTRTAVEQFVHDKSLIGHNFQSRYTVCTTSGTTGVPAILIYDANMMSVITALNVARSVPSWLTGGDLWQMVKRGARTAAIWATDGHFLGISMARKQLLERPSRASRMKIISALSPIQEIVEQLNEFQPAMLNAYATAAALLADEQEAGRLHISPILILTSSESLPIYERERIAHNFAGAKVRDNYGASEFVAAGYDCGHGWLHVNADWLILEPVDENYQPVAPGETSRSVLLTNLANRIQPIIRYEMGDRITINPDRCGCGSPLPAFRVEGRTDDVLRFRAMDGTELPILPLALWAVMKETPNILRFQAIQTGRDVLEIRLEPTEAADPEDVWLHLCERVNNFLASHGAAHVIVLRSQQSPTRDPISGKYRHIWIDKRVAESPILHLEKA